jgi:hypothetical protein
MTAAQQQAAQQQAFTPPPASGGGFTAPPGGYGAPPPPPGGGNAPIAPNQIPPVSPAEAAKSAALGRIQQQMSQAPGMTNPVNAEYLAAAKRYLPASQTRTEQVQAAAAARIQPPKTPEQQAILDQIRARGSQAEVDKAARVAALQQRAQAAGGYTPPRDQAPVAAPVAPTELPPAAPAPQTTLDQLRSRLQPQTPEQIAKVEAYNALSPAEKARQTRAENAAKKGPPGTVSMITDEGAEMWRTLKTKTQTLKDGTVVKTYPYDEAGNVKVRETKAPGEYGRTERTYTNTKTGAMMGEQIAGKNDLLDRWIELPDGTEINQRFTSEMRNGKPVRTSQIEVLKNEQNDIYIDGKYSHSYDKKRNLVNRPVHGSMPDIESLMRKIKGE